MTTLQWLLLTGAVTLVLGFYLYGRRLQDEDPWHGVEHEDDDDGHLDFQSAGPDSREVQEEFDAGSISPHREETARDATTPTVPGAREWAESRTPPEQSDGQSAAGTYTGPMPKQPQSTGFPYENVTPDDDQRPESQPESSGYDPAPVRLRADARPKRKARWNFLKRGEPEDSEAENTFDEFDDDPIEATLEEPDTDSADHDEYRDRAAPRVDGPDWLQSEVRPPPTELVSEVGSRQAPDVEAAAPKAPHIERTAEPAPDPQMGLDIENERPGARKEERIKNVPDGEEKIVILHVRAKNGGPGAGRFEGPAIHSALQLCRLRFGMRSIYHRVTEVNGIPEVVFSCASMVKPGYLDPAEAQDFTTPGLTFFMVLPGPIDGVAAFRDLLNTADKLALRLNGEVLDESRTRITHQSAQYMRDEIAELERQWRVPAKGR